MIVTAPPAATVADVQLAASPDTWKGVHYWCEVYNGRGFAEVRRTLVPEKQVANLRYAIEQFGQNGTIRFADRSVTLEKVAVPE